ncbi:hypothetical protein RRV45_12290 [Bacillus sp. DTU_2020_1000418_1_SI_GHA_SEK_038]|uniref:hypothetical protein n=1 Tax=Bacillus sp. DTU_2020_1000418_1_SI_GHA_SEK_038 TaxID=3077585 RepID=UPI0028F03016|nr:hypothetical protein [Bacillus sp. DTU_2020_1000418_1_SI_GHA_SEK_038]WNS73698.1 hypothetical protein RRV45_12290 [Bacillus sp. DTU_2020_1000418_1_SI_GHA_SEK_038]
MTKDLNIPRNHKDIGFRSLAVMFKDEFIPFTGIKLPKVKDIIETNVPMIEVKDRGMDLNFLLEDGTIAHIEFESDALKEADLIRFAHYDLQLYNQRQVKIRRIIIFSSGVADTTIKQLDIGSVKQQHDCIFLEHDFNGDEIFGKIKERIVVGDLLTNLEKLQILLLPMMKTNQATASKRAYELTKTLEQYHNKDLAHYLIGAMVAVNYSQIKDPEKAKILEVLEMAKPFEELYKKFEMKGRQEGIQEGRREGQLEIIQNLINKGIGIAAISDFTGLSEQEIKELLQSNQK